MSKRPQSSESSSQAIRLKPSIFPIGFSVAQVGSSTLLIDFLDHINGKTTVIESVAVPADRARDLARAILEGCRSIDSEGSDD